MGTYIGTLFHGPSIFTVIVNPLHIIDIRIYPVNVFVGQIQGDVGWIQHFRCNQLDGVASVHIGSIDAGAPFGEKQKPVEKKCNF